MTEPTQAPRDRRQLREGEGLLSVHRTLGVPIPAYRGRSLGNVASTLWSALGPPQVTDAPPLPPLEPDLDPFHGRRPEGPVVLLMLDGLGWPALVASAGREPDGPAARWASHTRPLTTVFPTTTTVALTSLSTGAAPSQHGVLGHRLYLPQFGTVVELLRMSPLGVSAAETLVGADWSPSMISAVPSIFRRGIPSVALSKDRFEGTGFTRLIYDGATFVPYASGSDLALSLTDLLARSEPPTLIFAYRDDLDVTQHLRGVRPELVDLELERVNALLRFVRRHLPSTLVRRTKLLITGDHGQVPVETEHQLAVDREPDILPHLARPPSGDRRAAYFAARPGHLSALRESIEPHLPPGGHLLEMPSALEAGLFGPPPFHPEIAERLGDLLLLLPSPGGVTYSVPGTRPHARRMRATHGGLELDELLIPFVSGTLEELAPTAGSSSSPSRHTPAGPEP